MSCPARPQCLQETDEELAGLLPLPPLADDPPPDFLPPEGLLALEEPLPVLEGTEASLEEEDEEELP